MEIKQKLTASAMMQNVLMLHKRELKALNMALNYLRIVKRNDGGT